MNIIEAIHRIARACGYDFRRYSRDNFAAVRRAHLLRTAVIDTVLDVGAHKGTFGTELRQEGYRGRVISFEPITQAFACLRKAAAGDTKWECRQLALGDTDGETQINVSGRLSSSSMLAIGRQHVDAQTSTRYVGRETIRVARLDTLAPSMLTPDDRVYMKLDVQGFEKRVLEGSLTILAQVQYLEIEMSLVPLYDGSPLYREMLDYVDQRGYDLVSVEDVFIAPDSGHVLQIDGIFARRPKAVMAR